MSQPLQSAGLDQELLYAAFIAATKVSLAALQVRLQANEVANAAGLKYRLAIGERLEISECDSHCQPVASSFGYFNQLFQSLFRYRTAPTITAEAVELLRAEWLATVQADRDAIQVSRAASKVADAAWVKYRIATGELTTPELY